MPQVTRLTKKILTLPPYLNPGCAYGLVFRFGTDRISSNDLFGLFERDPCGVRVQEQANKSFPASTRASAGSGPEGARHRDAAQTPGREGSTRRYRKRGMRGRYRVPATGGARDEGSRKRKKETDRRRSPLDVSLTGSSETRAGHAPDQLRVRRRPIIIYLC